MRKFLVMSMAVALSFAVVGCGGDKPKTGATGATAKTGEAAATAKPTGEAAATAKSEAK